MLIKKNKKNYLISVIINCHNGEEYLEKCVQSVIEQTYKNWEIIFYDNKSNDSSYEILKRFKDNRIKYYASKKKLNLYKARNLAINKCNGSLVTFLDVDDWWIKTKLDKQVKYFSKNSDLDILYSNIFLFFQKNKKKKIFIKKITNKNLTQKLVNKFEMPIQSVMIKKKFFKKNKFNSKYTIIGDLDFFVRASKCANIHGLNEPLVFYREHDQNLTKKKVGLHLRELELWVKNIKKEKEFLNINFDNIYFLIDILNIKNLILNKKIFQAIKKIFKKPIRSIKLIFLYLFNFKKL